MSNRRRNYEDSTRIRRRSFDIETTSKRRGFRCRNDVETTRIRCRFDVVVSTSKLRRNDEDFDVESMSKLRGNDEDSTSKSFRCRIDIETTSNRRQIDVDAIFRISVKKVSAHTFLVSVH